MWQGARHDARARWVRWRRRWTVRDDGLRSWPGWARGRVSAGLAVLVGLLLIGHSVVPNAGAGVGSLLETFLPWLGLAVPVLLILALWRRSATGLLAVLVPAVAWLGLFGGFLLPGHLPGHLPDHLPDHGVAADLTAVTHNVSDENADPAATARALNRVRPDLVALAELTPAARPAYLRGLGSDHPHYAMFGTVGLWSRYPIADARQLDIRPVGIPVGWDRGLRATVRLPTGDVAVYVAHLPSVRLRPGSGFDSTWRDESARLLGAAMAAEPLRTIILLGDFNSTVDDRGLGPVTARMDSTGSGFAFSWPAVFPVARVDQIMTRSATITELWSLPATGSDHLPIAARIALPER